MLVESASQLGIDLHSSILVGDRWRDIEAGQAAGCECFFVDSEYDEKQPIQPYTTINNLYEVAIIKGHKSGQ